MQPIATVRIVLTRGGNLLGTLHTHTPTPRGHVTAFLTSVRDALSQCDGKPQGHADGVELGQAPTVVVEILKNKTMITRTRDLSREEAEAMIHEMAKRLGERTPNYHQLLPNIPIHPPDLHFVRLVTHAPPIVLE